MGVNSKAMFELTQSMQWTRLEQTLEIEHFGRSLAIPIAKLILRLFKEYKPILPSMYHFFSKQLLRNVVSAKSQLAENC